MNVRRRVNTRMTVRLLWWCACAGATAAAHAWLPLTLCLLLAWATVESWTLRLTMQDVADQLMSIDIEPVE